MRIVDTSIEEMDDTILHLILEKVQLVEKTGTNNRLRLHLENCQELVVTTVVKFRQPTEIINLTKSELMERFQLKAVGELYDYLFAKYPKMRLGVIRRGWGNHPYNHSRSLK